MNLLIKRRARRVLPLVAGLGLGAALGMAAAMAVVYAAADKLDIVEKKRTIAKIVTTVDRNTALTVIGKEGAWYKVEVGGKQGYAYETAVAAKPGAKAKGIALSQIKPGKIDALEQAAAVRGANPLTREYASAQGLSLQGLEQLFRDRDAMTAEEFEGFLAEGALRAAQAPPATGRDQSDVALNPAGATTSETAAN